MIRLIPILVCLLVSFAWFTSDPVDSMSQVDLATPCGATMPQTGVGGGDTPAGKQKCEGKKACKSCFKAANNCWLCNNPKKFKTCVDHGTEICNASEYSLNCGRPYVYQWAGQNDPCTSCVGSGSSQNGDCTRPSCHSKLVS